jgi:acyl-[acyl carrier protein]--UDP-N-acetylglucosamine O-acyltransferase
MRRFPTILILSALALGLALPPLASASDNDIDKVNGTARVEAGQHAGDVSSVNGSVEIGDHAVVQKASTVNGSVTLGDKAQASELGTVNGAITLGRDSRVRGEVEAVNGQIQLGQGADVGGKVDTVNGAIELDAAHVAGGIETVSGDIAVGANSRVEGGILIDKPHGWFSHDSRTPKVVIGPHAVVQGTLEFRREVVLKVSDSAQIGPVKGATPVKFSGATP